MNLALSNNLKIINTFVQKPLNRKWTWRSPDGKNMNELDHMLYNDMRMVQNYEILNKFQFSSDHRIGKNLIRKR